MMSEPFTLLTERLQLRQPVAGDAEAIACYRGLPEIARYQSWSAFDADDARALIAKQACLVVNTPGSWFQLVIVTREASLLIGDLALHFRDDDDRQVEIGVNLAPSAQENGYAGEAVRRVLAYLFEELGKHRVMAVTDALNVAAARLFLRAGFRQEAHLHEHVWFKGQYGSEYLFAMLGREWRARAG